MSISASFHRNVSLITQFVPPSDEFKKHFREGMFDKPNTAGFISVSHFLLTSYNAERFREFIQWPLSCKKSEAKYRKDVRELFLKIAAENSDITFPTILHSHLFHASGFTFLGIMWKLSQVVLRTCIKRQTGEDLMRMPKIGAGGNATAIKYQKGVNKSISEEIARDLKALASMREITAIAIRKEREALAAVKAEIFEKEKRIVECSETAPVQALIKKRLVDINDEEVIEVWKAHIMQGLATIAECNRRLKKIEDRTEKVYTVVMNNAEKKVLDGKELEKIDLSNIPEISRENSGLGELYNDNQLVLKSFFQLFHTLLERVELCLKRRNLRDFSDCTTRLEESQEYLKTVRAACFVMLENINELSSETKEAFNEQEAAGDLDDSVSSSVMNTEILMPSPNINIDTNVYNYEGHDLQSRLALTPVEGAHKRLFSRYVSQSQTYQDSGVRLRPNMFLSRMNLDDTMSSLDSQHSRQRRLSPRKFLCPKTLIAGRYSRLFSNQSNRSNRTIGNDSIMSLPCSSKANSTAIANAIGEMRDISELNLDMTMKSLCDISADVTEKSGLNNHEKPEETAIPLKPSFQEIQEKTEVEITSHGILTKQQSQQRRRSIGDLVERYKNLVDASKRTQSPTISAIPQEDE